LQKQIVKCTPDFSELDFSQFFRDFDKSDIQKAVFRIDQNNFVEISQNLNNVYKKQLQMVIRSCV